MTIKRISRTQNNSPKVVVENSKNNPTPRHEYLVEKERIKNEIGNLEEIRLKLGLSQRRACQLLLVDPSAWTRWNKTEAPPHIYQALKWLLELRKVNPEAAGPRNFESRLDYMQTATHSKIERLEAQIEMLEKAIALTSTASPSPYFATPSSDDFTPTLDAIERKLSELELKIEAAQAKLVAPKAKRSSRKAVSKIKKRKTRKPLQKKTKSRKRSSPRKKLLSRLSKPRSSVKKTVHLRRSRSKVKLRNRS